MEREAEHVAAVSREDIPLYPTEGDRGAKQTLSNRLRSARDVWVAIIACLGAMSMGYSLGYSSPALNDNGLLKVLNSSVKKSWFGSLMAIGAMIGGPLGAVCVGQVGRKTTLMLCNLPLVVGWFLIIYSKELVLLYIGRFLTGLGVGAVSLAAPVYVAEVATANRRGALGSGFQLLVTIGIFMVYALGAGINYSWLAVGGAALSFLHAVLLLIVPETPRWLLGKRESARALSSLTWLRGGGDIQAEYDEMEQNISNAQLDGSSRLTPRDFFQPRIFKPLLLSVGLMVFQQASGVNAVIFYTTPIFKTAGFSANPAIPTMVVGAVLVVATILSCIFADTAGRRVLLIVSEIFMTLSIVALGFYFYLTEVAGVKSLAWLSLLSLIIYIAFFSIGLGPLPWLIMSEILPSKARGLCGGIATCVNWLFAFITTKEFEDLESALNKYGAFWAFGGVCLVGILFIAFFLPETKGKSLEEIEDHFSGRA